MAYSSFRLAEYFPDAPIADYLRRDSSLFRVCNRLYDSPLFRVNQGMVKSIACFEARIKGINLRKVTGDNYLSYQFSGDLPPRVLEICAVKYIISSRDIEHDQYSRCLVMYDRVNRIKTYLYRNNLSFPRAFLLEDVDENKIKRVLLDNYTVPLLRLKITDKAWLALSSYKDVDIKWTPNTFSVSSESAFPAFLFLSEMFDPGWKATVDGLPVHIVSPFNFFMGVFLSSGKHVVEFQFKPAYFYVFFAISLAALFTWTIVVVCLVIHRAVRVRRRRHISRI